MCMIIKTKKRKMGKCTCKNCGVEFEKPLTELRRNEKLNRPNFCSRTCVGKCNIKNLKEYREQNRGVQKRLPISIMSKLKYHFKSVKSRNKPYDITIDDLKEIWDKQDGRCYFTNVPLELMSHSKKKPSPIYSASLDRIDSNLGYVKENIRWVSKPINYMKHTMSDDMTWELCNLIKDNLIKKGLEIL
jgi:hypothetical protein